MPSRQQLANAIRALSMDAVQRANSGHPGAPMGMADIAQVLWCDYLNHSPSHPNWCNRDRFVLSNGHGSMLLYSLLHLSGYDVSIDDLKAFRQLHSKTPGHPEVGETPGVETTTGPLGQGIANAVGMALAERLLAERYNQPDHAIIDHHTYAFLGDGCLMEGISHEVCSLAGTWKLGKLIAFWDNNRISIDGDVEPWFTDDVEGRFNAYGWHVISEIDGHDPEAIHAAIAAAKAETDRPTLINCRTVIGQGAPNLAGSEKCHGAPLGETEIQAARAALHWPHEPFVVPQDIQSAWDATRKGEALESAWQGRWEAYKAAYPDLAEEYSRRMNGVLPESLSAHFQEGFEKALATDGAIATRKASQQVLNQLVSQLPEFIGGSADLTGSNLTKANTAVCITEGKGNGNYIHYGVREFGMAAIMNGLALHGGFIPFGGTFLTFLDYMRNAVRMSALMEQQAIYVFTHDSIGLGEDGPTHQPVEHLAMLRATPNLYTWRPADLLETYVSWQAALNFKRGPTCLALSRQSLPALNHFNRRVQDVERGGYVLKNCRGTPEAILIATGSEVAIALAVADKLEEHYQVRVVSMPCMERYMEQDLDYRRSVLDPNTNLRVAIEAGASLPWYRFTGLQGRIVGLDNFGLSAPAGQAYASLGFDVDKISAMIDSVLQSEVE